LFFHFELLAELVDARNQPGFGFAVPVPDCRTLAWD
jgi:hypothetical protein